LEQKAGRALHCTKTFAQLGPFPIESIKVVFSLTDWKIHAKMKLPRRLAKRNLAMQINIPPAEHKQLAALAELYGFSSAEEYAANILINAVQLEAFADLSPEEMEESVKSIGRGIEQSKAGLGIPVKEAMQGIAENLGLKFQR